MTGPRQSGYEYSLSDFRSTSLEMREVLRVARRVADTNSSILILGETGVGKEWLAQGIHRESDRVAGPFVPVNTAALSETLLESELFGHERGAFTDAHRLRRGQFEMAEGGTLFLDEIGDMSLTVQAKLLRVLEDRRIQRLGGETQIDVDVRIIAATNQDLGLAMKESRFRSDLYFRLGVIVLTVPPLRTRREDIAATAVAAAERLARYHQRPGRELSPEAITALAQYDWPGNIRELLNVIERAVLLAEGPTLKVGDLPPHVTKLEPSAAEPKRRADTELDRGHDVAERDSSSQLSLPADWRSEGWRQLKSTVTAELELRYVSALLEKTRGRVGHAAELAGLSPRSFYELMRAHELDKESFRSKSGA